MAVDFTTEKHNGCSCPDYRSHKNVGFCTRLLVIELGQTDGGRPRRIMRLVGRPRNDNLEGAIKCDKSKLKQNQMQRRRSLVDADVSIAKDKAEVSSITEV